MFSLTKELAIEPARKQLKIQVNFYWCFRSIQNRTESWKECWLWFEVRTQGSVQMHYSNTSP